MRTLKLLLVIVCLFVLAPILAAGDAFAENLWLKEQYRWVQIATSPDRNTAIGIARLYKERGASVVRIASGSFGVLLGPVKSRTIGEFRLAFDKGWAGFDTPARSYLVNNWLKLPESAILSTGKEYRQSIWYQNSGVLAADTFNDSTKVKYRKFSVAITSGGGQTNLILRDGTKPEERLDFQTPEDRRMTDVLYGVQLSWLDHTKSHPQIILTAYTTAKGVFSHVWVFSEAQGGGWRMFDAGAPGRYSYVLDDINGDGNAEMLGADQRFSQPFGDAAAFAAPPIVKRLLGDQLRDVTSEPAALDPVKQAVASFEFVGRMLPDIWHTNAYLAGWVATKTRAGDFSAAWSKMLSMYDAGEEPKPVLCTEDKNIEACPDSRTRAASFPEALAARLRFAGYPVPDTLPDMPDGLPEPGAVVAKAPPSDGSASGKSEAKEKGQLYSGSGFFVATGKLVSNAHVVEGCQDVTVKLGGVEGKGHVAARDVTNDLALIETAVPTGPLATLRTAPRLGETISAFGFPLTDILATTGNFTRGNVTATAGMGDDSRFLQISAPVQPGNSGGPLLDEGGNVVGIVNAKIDALVMAKLIKDIPENINFAIKSSILENFLDARGVSYTSGTLATKLDPADIADRAQSFTAIIFCRT